MLVRLFAENFGPFRDGFDLSLEALDLPAEGDRGYFEVPIDGEDKPLRLLRLAAIYGANASGKSTVVNAAHALRYMVVRSGPGTQVGDPIRAYEPFLFDGESRESPCVLGCVVVVSGRLFEYRIGFTQEEVKTECITDVTTDRPSVWLDRQGPTIHLLHGSLGAYFDEDFGDVVRSNAAALSVAAQLKQETIMDLYRAIRDSLLTVEGRSALGSAMSFTLNQMRKDDEFRRWAIDRLVRVADFGVTDVRVKEREVPTEVLQRWAAIDGDESNAAGIESRKYLEPELVHRGAQGDHAIDMDLESAGTMKLLALAGPWYDVIRKGRTLFADELSASLHPELLSALLDAFNAPSDFPPSQLILTLHDPSPLEGVLRRDQVFFTEKDDHGVATLFPLSEFKERDVHNLRKRYLQGRYGAVPRALDFRSLFENGND